MRIFLVLFLVLASNFAFAQTQKCLEPQLPDTFYIFVKDGYGLGLDYSYVYLTVSSGDRVLAEMEADFHKSWRPRYFTHRHSTNAPEAFSSRAETVYRPATSVDLDIKDCEGRPLARMSKHRRAPMSNEPWWYQIHRMNRDGTYSNAPIISSPAYGRTGSPSRDRMELKTSEGEVVAVLTKRGSTWQQWKNWGQRRPWQVEVLKKGYIDNRVLLHFATFIVIY